MVVALTKAVVEQREAQEAGLSVAQSCNTVLKGLRQEVGEFKVSQDYTKQNEVRRWETLEM